MRKPNYVAVLLVITFVFVGCAGIGLSPEDTDKAYLAALKEYTQTAEKYNVYYASADETTKAEWKENIDPYFIKANSALEVWKLALKRQEAPDVAESEYLLVKQQLFSLLVEVFNKE